MVLQPDGTRAFMPANFVMGRARIDERPVVVGGDDFTVRGGAMDAAIPEKQIMAEQLANEYQLPLVRLIEGTGGGGSIKALVDADATYVPANPGWDWVVANLATVPVVSLALGPVAGLGAARLVASHYSLMVREQSQVFVAGPPLVKHLGEDVTKEELGGAALHGVNGTVSDVVDSEEEAFERTRQFLSYLPSSVYDVPERTEPHDDPARTADWLIGAIPRNRRARLLDPADHRGRRRRGLVVRDRPRLGPLDRHRSGPTGRLAGRRGRLRHHVLRRGADGRLVAEAGGLRRSRRHVPPARSSIWSTNPAS